MDLPYKFYGPAQGLSANLVTAIQQDTLGYLWIGTNNGLNRFDGYQFQKFFPEANGQRVISDRYVQRIIPLNPDRWLITYRNNNLFFDLLNPYSWTVQKINLFPANGVQGNVHRILPGREESVLVIATLPEALRIYRYHTGDTLQLALEVDRTYLGVTPDIQVVELAGGGFLINDAQYGLLRIMPNGEQRPYTPADLPVAGNYSWPRPTAILQSARNGQQVYLSFSQFPYLFRFDPATDQWTQVRGLDHSPGLEYSSLWQDHSGQAVVSLTNGQGTYPVANKLFFLPQRGEAEDWSYLLGITRYVVNLFGQDFRHMLFFGADTGLKTYHNTYFQVENYLDRPLPEDEYGAVMRGIDHDTAGNVYFAREYAYWYQLDEGTGQLDTLKIRTRPNEPPIPFQCSFKVLYQTDQSLWGVACLGDGQGAFIRYDLETKLSSIYRYPSRFYDFIAREPGRFWLITNDADRPSQLVLFDQRTGQFTPYRTAEGNNPFREYNLTCLVAGPQGALWIGSNRGLFRLNPANEELELFTHEENLVANTIQNLLATESGEIWIGTSEGITVLDTLGKHLRDLTQNEGLSNNKVSAIVTDRDRNIWISTHGGLTVQTDTAKHLRNYYRTDGFASDVFTTRSALLSPEGYVYLGSVNGFSRFRPTDLLQKEPTPKPRIARIDRYNETQDTIFSECTVDCQGRAIVMGPRDTYLEISFFLPQFEDPAKNQFRFQLVPRDATWTNLGNQNQRRFSRPPPGRYQLHLQAADPSGQWSEQTTTLSLTVLPYWYQTWSARLAGLIVAGLLILGIFRYQLQQRLRMERMRTKLASDLHDEVSGLLSGIAFQSDLLQTQTKNQDIQEKLRYIGQVSRKAAAKMHDVLWSIDSRKDRVRDLVQRMREHAEDLLIPKDIQFVLHLHQIDEQKKLPVSVRQDLFFLFKEAINNVAKHAQADRVEVRLEALRKGFRMRIHDNGQLHPKDLPETGQGLKNMHMRASRLGGKLTIQRQSGFTVQLDMPKW